MADCGREGTGYTGYKIWLRRSDTHRRITDTNIWVGNIHIPKDAPYCKISSGKTNGECWAYVEFDTWDDLLKAIGIEPETVEIELDGELFQEDTEKTKVYLEFDGELEQVEGERSRNIRLGGAIVQTNDETAIGIRLGGTITQEGEPPAPPYLEIQVTPDGSVPYSGGRKTLSVVSNINWSISTNVTWMPIEGGYSGANDGTRTIVVDPRDSGYSVRSGDVTVFGGGLRKQATIEQDGQELVNVEIDGELTQE